jgi:hypothetical protein
MDGERIPSRLDETFLLSSCVARILRGSAGAAGRPGEAARPARRAGAARRHAERAALEGVKKVITGSAAFAVHLGRFHRPLPF